MNPNPNRTPTRRTNATNATRVLDGPTDGPTDRRTDGPTARPRDRLPSVRPSVRPSVGPSAPRVPRVPRVRSVVVWCARACVCVCDGVRGHTLRGMHPIRRRGSNSRVSTPRVWSRLGVVFGHAGVVAGPSAHRPVRNRARGVGRETRRLARWARRTRTRTTTTAASSTGSTPSSSEDGSTVGRRRGKSAPGGDIRAARERCREARDAYHARGCGGVDEGEEGSRGNARSACEGLRRAYEAACPRSWVEHFERGRVEEARLRAALGTSAGAGKTG